MILLAFAGAGCDEDEVRVYAAPKAPPPSVPAAAMPSTGAAPAQVSSLEAISWTVPSGWRRQEEERPMRAATFDAGTGESRIEIAVSHFPGDVGGLLANVNRWGGQIGAAPVAEAELDAMLTHFDSAGFHGHLMRLEGPDQHTLGAVLEELGGGRTWFVKATGTAAQIDAIERDFDAFARSFSVDGAAEVGH